MKFLKQSLLLLLTSALLFTACSDDDDDKKELGEKEGILLVTFGSSYPGPKDTFKNIEEEVKKEYSNMEVRWAYTSHIIRNILLGRGEDIDSPEEAMKKMKEDGFSKIILQSLHVIPGAEYNDLKATMEKFVKENEGMKVSLGHPLMYDDSDLDELGDILVDVFKAEKEAGEAVVFMGHGTHHEANDRYSRFQEKLTAKAANFFVGTVEASPTLDDVIAKLEKTGIKTVTVTPLMSVAGDHANNDMAGDEEDSWKTVLEAKGYAVKTVLKGLGDYDDIVAIWGKHLKEVKEN
ncbi:MAG: sirohydrochlorin cobaltochelatase [Marinifilaceae bacterium]